MNKHVWMILGLAVALPPLHAAAPSPSSSAAPSFLSTPRGEIYATQLSLAIQANVRYPSDAQSAGVQGTALVMVREKRSGEFISATLVQSSGNPSLDAEATTGVWDRMNAVHAWLPIPRGYNPSATDFSFQMPINFRLPVSGSANASVYSDGETVHFIYPQSGSAAPGHP
jgi:TonB family protein